MGHFSTAEVLSKAGADPHPPDGLFRNIWDPEELRNIIKNLENYNDPINLLPGLLDEAAVQFIYMDQLSDAEEMCRRVLEGYEKVYGVEDFLTMASIHKLASVLQDQGKHEMAEELYRRELEWYEKMFGVGDFSTLNSINKLASVLQDQGKHEMAEEMYRRALEGYEKIREVKDLMPLETGSDLASVLENQGKYEAAEEVREKRRRWESSIPTD